MAKSVKNYPLPEDEQQIPNTVADMDVLYWLSAKKIDFTYMNLLKEYTAMNDEIISSWFDVSVKTLRNYRKPEAKLKDGIKEHLILLISLFKHGAEVFGTKEKFDL